MAARYGTDPWTVLGWEPDRFFVAVAGLATRDLKVARLLKRAGHRKVPLFVTLSVADVASMLGQE